MHVCVSDLSAQCDTRARSAHHEAIYQSVFRHARRPVRLESLRASLQSLGGRPGRIPYWNCLGYLRGN